MDTSRPDQAACDPATGCCAGGTRRAFLHEVGLGLAAAALSEAGAMAGPFSAEEFDKLVPADKKLTPQWLASLTARGEPAVYRGKELEFVGLPIGGIGCGQLYLGGDGRLWLWDVFNLKPAPEASNGGGPHYARPARPASPLEQGFAVRVVAGGKPQVRTLDRDGFSDVRFRGEYPIGTVDYRDPDCPVTVRLEAFSPFIPLDADSSSLPATILQYTVHNPGTQRVEVELGGWLQNAVCLRSGAAGLGRRHNRVTRTAADDATVLVCSAAPAPPDADKGKKDILFEDFEKSTYEGWTVTGTAFGAGPVEMAKMPAYQGPIGARGKRLAHSHHTRGGEDVAAGDRHQGTLTSKPFPIERRFIHLLLDGGNHPGKTCVELLVEDRVVRSLTGHNDNRMRPESIDVGDLLGKTARLRIADRESGAWGNIGVDHIVFSDRREPTGRPLTGQPDFGTLALAVLGPAKTIRAAAALPDRKVPTGLFPGEATPPAAESAAEFDQPLLGGLTRQVTVEPGKDVTVSFVLAWHFPHLRLDGLDTGGGRRYGKRFKDAAAVVQYLLGRFDALCADTRRWRDTWYDSTLPYWFLDRTFLNTSILATSTCYWFANDRFYGWEGVGCCPGTCTHVWHYAHAPARLFPVLERILRDKVDYGVAFHPKTGVIGFRGEFHGSPAIDGQAGSILRAYREHQMSADDGFLRRLWPRVKRSLEFLIERDGNGDGIIEGAQHNTLDADWFGKIAWLSSLYVAALRAGEEMARTVGDEAFAGRAGAIAAAGGQAIDRELYNGEYYIQLADPKRADTLGSYGGCEVDQVFGQSWAFQVGLGRILDREKVCSALRALWRYNFAPDVGRYRAVHKGGRWYAMPGEAGLLMLTYPKGPPTSFEKGANATFAGYFNECMTGFEYQVAGHMLWEGMLTEGLAITRAIHDRYHPARRNPYNEIECGDHYARAMASYGVFLAACGYEYYGPNGYLAFAPRLSPNDFRAAFTAAEGWGRYTQKRSDTRQESTVEVRHGRLRLRRLAFAIPTTWKSGKVMVSSNGKEFAATLTLRDGRATIDLAGEVTLEAKGTLRVTLEAT